MWKFWRYYLAILAVVAVDFSGVMADPSHAQAPVRTVCPHRFTFVVAEQEFRVPYCARQPIDTPDAAAQLAVVVLHGDHRNATSNQQSVVRASTRAGVVNALVVTPQFLVAEDASAHALGRDLPVWSEGGWKEGDQSRPSPAEPGRPSISTYTVVDALLLRLSDRTRFPKLEQIVVAGHSAGGQFVHRYAAANAAEPALQVVGISVRYVVASPSSYLYFDSRRPVPAGSGELEIPTEGARAACPRYNEYRYGLEDLNRYTRAVGADGLRAQYASRTVVFLLGGRDNDPTAWDMDSTCAAALQGADRLERGNLYFASLGEQFGPDIYTRQSKAIVPEAGHSPSQVFNSPAGRTALFARETGLQAPVR
jgi:pimeloyl-ACP methyl ester carboxylesterase